MRLWQKKIEREREREREVSKASVDASLFTFWKLLRARGHWALLIDSRISGRGGTCPDERPEAALKAYLGGRQGRRKQAETQGARSQLAGQSTPCGHLRHRRPRGEGAVTCSPSLSEELSCDDKGLQDVGEKLKIQTRGMGIQAVQPRLD